MAQLKKPELIKILVEEYGYEKEDIKLFTNAKLNALIKQEEKESQEYDKQEVIEKITVTNFNDNDEITVMYGGNGMFKHTSREGRVWRFAKFGQLDKMPFKEILLIKNVAPKVFTDGYIIVMNKEVQEIAGLVEIYENIITPENIERAFTMQVDELKVFVDNLPEGMKISFIGKAREMYEAEELYDLRIIKMIEEKFGFSLKDNAPLSNFL